eukprot:gene6581-7085_t
MLLLAVLFGIITLLIVIYLIGKLFRPSALRRKEDVELKGKEFIDLLPNEQSRLLHISSVSTITFFDGEVPIKIIQDRLFQIVKANPWLTGRLFTVASDHEPSTGQIVLAHTKPEDLVRDTVLSDHFLLATITDETIDVDTPAEIILERFSSSLVKFGKNCLNKSYEVLFKVIVLKIMKNSVVSRTAFILSMSHVMGDGHTFYSIHSMFDSSTVVQTLQPRRLTDFPQQLNSLTGHELQEFGRSYILLAGALIRRFIIRPKNANYCFRIDLSKIEELKKDYVNNRSKEVNDDKDDKKNSFISTNDILTSWFFKEDSNVKYGIMPVNYRGRFQGITNEHAGNYQSSIFYTKDTFNSPEGIREMLVNYDRKKACVPSIQETLSEFPFSLVTNWSTFYKDIHFTEENKLLFHSPLITGKNGAMSHVMIIFRPKEGQLGAYIFCRENKTEKELLQNYSFLSPLHTN